jgi:hypothetical protein
MAQNIYFRGQGRLFLASRDVNGNKTAITWVGNVSALSVSLETETLEHKESYTGQRLTDVKLITGKSAKVTATLESWDLDNLALGLYGQKVTVTGASVTNEVLPSGLAVNDIVQTANPKISTVVVKDSAGTPATLTLGTHYSIDDASYGRIKILNLASFVQPLKVDYAYAARKDVGMFTQSVPERWLSFHGLNTAVGNTPIIVDLFRVQLDPMSQLPLIGDEIAGYELAGEALVDDTKSASSPLGQFGRILDLT